jgi:predicted RNase H-like HicB family nuclease
MSQSIDYTVTVHQENGSYWAEVDELPGCFAAGDSLEELWESLREAVELYVSTPESKVSVSLGPTEPLARAETMGVEFVMPPQSISHDVVGRVIDAFPSLKALGDLDRWLLTAAH